ncbi:hypothetical protein ECZU17_31700 [Escherichia coli]|nr:hypothetical protein ECZU17_31700 [Escherichia coli]
MFSAVGWALANSASYTACAPGIAEHSQPQCAGLMCYSAQRDAPAAVRLNNRRDRYRAKA